MRGKIWLSIKGKKINQIPIHIIFENDIYVTYLLICICVRLCDMCIHVIFHRDQKKVSDLLLQRETEERWDKEPDVMFLGVEGTEE